MMSSSDLVPWLSRAVEVLHSESKISHVVHFSSPGLVVAD